MSCIPCFLTKAIPVCTENLTIGEVEIDTNYDVYITNVNTGFIIKKYAESDGDGLLIVDISDLVFSPNHKYNIQVVEAGDSIDKVVEITVPDQPEETVITCLTVPFVRVFNSDIEVEGQESAVLELDVSCDCE